MNRQFPYILRISQKAKHVRFQVSVEKGLQVVVPKGFSLSRVPLLIEKNSHWIERSPSFTVLDRSDSADLMNLVRNDRRLSNKAKRFPKKDTCLAIYSHMVNTCCELAVTLRTAFPWCTDWPDELKELFSAYVVAKQRNNVLDYDFSPSAQILTLEQNYRSTQATICYSIGAM
jgi:superfamily I DNA/RNA helicase